MNCRAKGEVVERGVYGGFSGDMGRVCYVGYVKGGVWVKGSTNTVSKDECKNLILPRVDIHGGGGGGGGGWIKGIMEEYLETVLCGMLGRDVEKCLPSDG